MAVYVGYNLMWCVPSIATGVIPIDQVDHIYSDSIAQSDEEWEVQLSQYATTWWRVNSEVKLAIARQLLAEGKIDQPRLRGEQVPPLPDPNSVWTEDGQPILAGDMLQRYGTLRGETE